MKSYRDFIVWQKLASMFKLSYRFLIQFLEEEIVRLTSATKNLCKLNRCLMH